VRHKSSHSAVAVGRWIVSVSVPAALLPNRLPSFPSDAALVDTDATTLVSCPLQSHVRPFGRCVWGGACPHAHRARLAPFCSSQPGLVQAPSPDQSTATAPVPPRAVAAAGRADLRTLVACLHSGPRARRAQACGGDVWQITCLQQQMWHIIYAPHLQTGALRCRRVPCSCFRVRGRQALAAQLLRTRRPPPSPTCNPLEPALARRAPQRIPIPTPLKLPGPPALPNPALPSGRRCAPPKNAQLPPRLRIMKGLRRCRRASLTCPLLAQPQFTLHWCWARAGAPSHTPSLPLNRHAPGSPFRDPPCFCTWEGPAFRVVLTCALLLPPVWA
jgi:hypothetical protein